MSWCEDRRLQKQAEFRGTSGAVLCSAELLLLLPLFCLPDFGEWVGVSGNLPAPSILLETRVGQHMTSSFFAGLVTYIAFFATLKIEGSLILSIKDSVGSIICQADL